MGEHVRHDVFKVVDMSVQRSGGSVDCFVRDPTEHQATLQAFFARTGGDYTRFNYLGEWHSHPAFEPVPSAVDVATMQSIVEDPSVGVNFLVLVALLRRRPNQSLRQRGRRQLDPSRRGEGAAEGTGGRWYLCRQRRLGVFRWYSRAWWRVSVRINAPAARGSLRTVATAAKCHRAPVDYHPVAGQMPTGLQ